MHAHARFVLMCARACTRMHSFSTDACMLIWSFDTCFYIVEAQFLLEERRRSYFVASKGVDAMRFLASKGVGVGKRWE